MTRYKLRDQFDDAIASVKICSWEVTHKCWRLSPLYIEAVFGELAETKQPLTRTPRTSLYLEGNYFLGDSDA